MKLFYIISEFVDTEFPEASMKTISIVSEEDYNAGYNASYGVEPDEVRDLLEQNQCYELQEGIYEICTSDIDVLRNNLNEFGLEEKEINED